LKGKLCYGIDLRKIPIDSLQQLRSIRLEYLLEFYNDLDIGEEFFTGYFDFLAGTDMLRQQITEGLSITAIKSSWKDELGKFKQIRAKYLLYPDF
jgi:uncharacterized protein YbbC (DUF1343 family)